MQYQRLEFRTIDWKSRLSLVLAAALGLGIVAALVVLSLGLAILLLPVVAVASVIGWFRWRKIARTLRENAGPAGGGDRVIEIDYHVVDDGSGRRR